MTSSAHDLFVRALELPESGRDAFLDEACGGDAELRLEVQRLLVDAARAEALVGASEGETLVGVPGSASGASSGTEKEGDRIGPYKLREQVGEGGFGTVWVADQEKPVRRRVALKIIKPGMDTKEVIARFEQERQALAMMDHPNIARVLDAGTTLLGRPFFVMELVRGVKITEYCDEQKLSTRERIELFITVCQAVQHAHQKGIIHRDIKPSNILVTLHDGVPVPKVIDFGIAKATEGRLTDNTVYTQLNQFIGTPAYMSPEQAEMSGLDIDTRSDIYSLGVLLYELLAGSTPFDAKELMSLGIDAMRRTIREKEPQRPSTKLATLQGNDLTATAKRRSVETSKLANLLRGDLDWIVMKCLEKDRQRRYESANGLAADLKRHLNNEPVTARPPSAAYRFQKAFRRNKLVFTAGTAVFVALCLGIIATTLQSVRATRAKGEAVAARQEAVANERKAVEAQASEAKLRQQADAARRQAEAAELAARQRAYASDMNVAKQALDGNNLGRALDLLNRQRPTPGQKDLRGWEWRYLWQQTRSDALFTLCEESSEINTLAVSPDGNLLAVGIRHRGGVAVWDLRTRKELVRLAEKESFARATFSPSGSLLALVSATVSPSGLPQLTLRLWNAATRQMVAELPMGSGNCFGLAFAKDGRTLVTSSTASSLNAAGAGEITLWRVPEGTKLASYPVEQAGPDPGTSFAASPDLSVAAYGMKGGRIGVLDLHNGKELWTAVASKEYILSLAFSQDGKTLASGAGFAGSDIRLWEVATGRPIGKLEGHGSWVSALVFWPDGKKLASSSADQTIRIWDIASQKCVEVLRGHRQEVWRLALLPDERTLLSGGKDGTVCFWDSSRTHPRQARITLSEKIVNWGFTADGRSILALDEQGRVSQWTGSDFQRKEPLLEIGPTVPDKYNLYWFSPDGRFLSTGSTNGVLQIWDLSRRVLARQWTNTSGEVQGMNFLPARNKFVSLSLSDNVLHEWDLTSGLETQSWPGPADFQGWTSVARDERSIMTIGHGGDIVFRNLAEKKNLRVELDVLEAAGTTYSPDGKLFAAASKLGHAKVWDTTTWRLVATLGGVLNGMHTVAFAPDGQRLAIASDGNEAVKLWATESWQDVFTLEGQGTGFKGAVFSPDGNTIAWGNQTGSLHLWRAPTWEEINAAEAKENAAGKNP